CGAAAGAKSRCYRQPIAGGAMTPVTPEGFLGGFVAPNGHVFTGTSPESAFVYDPTGATPPVQIKGLTRSDSAIAVGSDSHSLFGRSRESWPARIERVDILTGARTVVAEVMPPDQTGLTRFSIDSVIADGKGYAYTTTNDRGTLFVISGAK